MPGLENLSPHVAEIIRNADRTLRYIAPGKRRRLFNQWRVTMGTIAPVDSFYVAFFRDDRYLVVPYMFDQPREYEPPGFQMYGPDGLAAWIKRHARPYTYKMDNGALLNSGHSFGDEERLSSDAIVIPLLGLPPEQPAVFGIASMQTYQADTYTEETTVAFQALARSVATALAREREDLAHESALLSNGPLVDPHGASILDIVEDFGQTLESLRGQIDALANGDLSDPGCVRIQLTELRRRCEQSQADITELLMTPALDTKAIFDTLTPRELEVTELICADLTNDEIASRLRISEPTVKTHVTRILKKFGVRQRSAIQAKIRPFG